MDYEKRYKEALKRAKHYYNEAKEASPLSTDARYAVLRFEDIFPELAESEMEELEAHNKALHDFKVFATKQAWEHHISFVHDFEWNNFCGEILSYFNQHAEWS